MSANEPQVKGDHDRENIIIFKAINQNEEGQDMSMSQVEVNLPEIEDFSSIKINNSKRNSKRRGVISILKAICLLFAIVAAGIFFIRAEISQGTPINPVDNKANNMDQKQKEQKQTPQVQGASKKEQIVVPPESSSTLTASKSNEPVHARAPVTNQQPSKDISIPSKPSQTKAPTSKTDAKIQPESTKNVPKSSQSKAEQPKIENNHKVSLEKVMLPIDIPELSVSGHAPNFQHKHKDLTFDYPTLGIPRPGDKYNHTQVSSKDLAFFDEKINEYFKPYNDTDCEYVRYGKIDDGGYVLCKNFINYSHALLNVGVNGEDSFGCDITAAHPMPNYQYDCTNAIAPFCSKNNKVNYFSKVCIGEITQKTQFHTYHSYQDVLRSHNLTDKHVTLKIDCEGGEYPGFKALPLKYLDLIDQIVIELHFDSIYPEEWGMLDIFRTLSEKFVSVNYHNNNWGCFRAPVQEKRRILSRALQVSLVNRKLIKLKSESRSFAQHPLNRKNGMSMPYCQFKE